MDLGIFFNVVCVAIKYRYLEKQKIYIIYILYSYILYTEKTYRVYINNYLILLSRGSGD